ncbi:hypothetical protein RFI_29088 [Reticulomyxa filosa]|uniref:Uncharacterized protein n=1 Tax=Reticulomyxa filosa TaxID=46433 RepID=X6M3V9_RETFI|nr:hypothetical protein RFI_29088 [Reticulomyxa filosa]|eukprot:ETO08301.1 hypothetical protein RFI_29088 [Reticulomyxa filosa]
MVAVKEPRKVFVGWMVARPIFKHLSLCWTLLVVVEWFQIKVDSCKRSIRQSWNQFIIYLLDSSHHISHTWRLEYFRETLSGIDYVSTKVLLDKTQYLYRLYVEDGKKKKCAFAIQKRLEVSTKRSNLDVIEKKENADIAQVEMASQLAAATGPIEQVEYKKNGKSLIFDQITTLKESLHYMRVAQFGEGGRELCKTQTKTTTKQKEEFGNKRMRMVMVIMKRITMITRVWRYSHLIFFFF